MTTAHLRHGPHVHGEGRGSVAVPHRDLVGHVHDGHCLAFHDGHRDGR